MTHHRLFARSCIAAAMFAAGAVHAQTSGAPLLYGRIDLNITKFNGEAWTMDQTSTSRLGLRGVEDMGGGLSAIFQIEARINPDAGTAETPRFWGREAWVGLRSTTLGTFRMGRSLSPSQRIASQYDPHGTDGIGSFGSSGLLLGHPSATFVRFENALYYETPNWAGFTAFGAVSADETPNGTDDRFHSVRLRYAKGPLDVSIGHGKLRPGDDVNSLAAAYDFGFVRPMAQLHSGERAARKRASWLVGATAPIASGELRVAYSKQDDRGAAPEVDRTLAAVGYDYSMSKRTVIYGTVVRDKVSTDSARNGFEAGLRHSF